jgi:multiple sugar transport system permease protein
MMTTIVTFQSFSQIYLMTGTPAGGPQGTTSLIVYYIFEAGFIDLNFSYANAIALVLFVVILLLTLIQKRLEKHVTYE